MKRDAAEPPLNQDDLHSGAPYWRIIGAAPAAYPQLPDDITCEVAVVGGGITGVLAADRLIRAGVDAVIVDRETFAQGSTVASTGLLEYELDLPLVKLIPQFGETRAVRAYRCGLEAINMLEQLASEVPTNCGFARRPTMQFASHPADVAAMRHEVECRRHFGFDVQFFNRESLGEFGGPSAPGALWSIGDAELDPYALTQGTLQRFVAAGGRAYSSTEIVSIEENDESVTLHTKQGRISAQAVIVATGYTSERFTSQNYGTLHTTYATVSEPLETVPHWPQKCLIWETAHPYFYARTTADGRALIGGEDTSSPEDHENPLLLRAKIAGLIARFRELFGLPFRPAAAWAGVFGESRDGLPYIGLPPDSGRVYFALGYGGNGITFGMFAAQVLADLYLGRPNEDAFLFRFER